MNSNGTMPGRFGFVSIIGPPNAGKSTLLNRLAGEKIAIVSPRPQTTRNRIQGICTWSDAQVVFIDTPGIHPPRSRLNRALVDTARSALTGVDLVLLVLPVQVDPTEVEMLLRQVEKDLTTPLVLVLNKVDQVSEAFVDGRISRYRQESVCSGIIPISALTGEGVDYLRKEVVSRVPEGPPLFPSDMLTDVTERFIAAEIVREKIFLLTRDEIPYKSAVEVERFAERGDGVIEIDAVVTVERDTQKGIVIGKGGGMLKRIGTAARIDLEDFFQTKVMLRLFVHVRRDWTENDQMLREFGYR
ncbi:MAG: GTPase Era [Desulfuromonadia bacterium]